MPDDRQGLRKGPYLPMAQATGPSQAIRKPRLCSPVLQMCCSPAAEWK